MTSEISPSRVSATRVAAAKATATRAKPAPSDSQRNLVGRGKNAGAEPAHPPQPAVVVGGFAAEVVGDLGVREDQELLVCDAAQHDLGNLVRLQRVSRQELEAHPPLGGQHVGLDALGTEARNSDSIIAIRDGEPLEE